MVSYPGDGLRDRLAHVGAEDVRAGLVMGSGGKLSVRSPSADQFLEAVGRGEARI